MMQSDTINWGLAVALSLLVHSMIFMGRGAQVGMENAYILQVPLVTRLSFNRPVEKTVLDEPLPIKKQEPRPVKKIEHKPVKKKIVNKKQVKKKPIKSKQVIKRAEVVEKTEPVRQIAAPAQVQGQQVSHSSEGLLKRERQQYLHKLLSHIETFKFYPRAARKRSLEGNIKISFMLRDDGCYEQLSIDGRHTALVKATQHAMESAMPLPAPPKDIGLSRKIEFVMAYSLTQ